MLMGFMLGMMVGVALARPNIVRLQVILSLRMCYCWIRIHPIGIPAGTFHGG